MIVETVIGILLADAGVAAIYGDRVFPRMIPDGQTFPAVVVTKIGGGGNYTNDGDTGLEEAQIQVDLYHDDGTAKLIDGRNKVRRLLSGFKGGLESGSPCAIDSCFCMNDVDLSEPSRERTGPRLKRRMLQFRIWNREL